MDTTKMLNPSTVAQRLDVSERTIMRFIKDAKIAATKVGRQWRISENALEDYTTGQTISVKKNRFKS